MSDLHRFANDDDMAPARGCANGMARSAVIWAIVALAVLFLATRVYADAVMLPPAPFDHPFAGHIAERPMPLWEIPAARCRLYGDHEFACAWVEMGTDGVPICHMIMPIEGPDTPTAWLAQVERHELGHCNGWPANHPGAYFGS